MAVAPEEKIKFSDAGPAGIDRFEAGVAGYEARGFRGLGVFTSTPVRISFALCIAPLLHCLALL